MRGAAGPCQQPPDGLHQKLTSEAYMGSLHCPPSGVACGLPQARAPCMAGLLWAAPDHVFRQAHAAGQTSMMSATARLPPEACRPWRDRADGAGRQRPRLTHQPCLRSDRRPRTSRCGRACAPGLSRTPLPSGAGPALPPGGAPWGNAGRRTHLLAGRIRPPPPQRGQPEVSQPARILTLDDHQVVPAKPGRSRPRAAHCPQPLHGNGRGPRHQSTPAPWPRGQPQSIRFRRPETKTCPAAVERPRPGISGPVLRRSPQLVSAPDRPDLHASADERPRPAGHQRMTLSVTWGGSVRPSV